MAEPCAPALPAVTGTLGHGPCPCSRVGSEPHQQSQDPVSTRLPRCNLRVPHAAPSVPAGCSQQALAGGMHQPLAALGKQGTHPTCFSMELGNTRKSRGTWGNAGQGAGAGHAAGGDRQDCAPGVTWLSPKPLLTERRGKRLQASPPLAPNPLPCPLFVCLSLCSCCCIASHIFQPAEQGWELLSIARLSNSKTGQGHPRRLLPRQTANLHRRNGPFWGNA